MQTFFLLPALFPPGFRQQNPISTASRRSSSAEMQLIMNMMLVSVSERTKEIGLRKALGAEPMRIQMQFLIEAVVLSVFGGIIGVIIGEIVAYVGAVMLKTTYSASVSAIMLGLGFSLAVGIVFGWAPARRASRLNPIDALRAE